MMEQIMEDKRKIRAIAYEYTSFDVGTDGVTKIEPYQESGQMSMVTWFAIWKGEFLYARMVCVLSGGGGMKKRFTVLPFFVDRIDCTSEIERKDREFPLFETVEEAMEYLKVHCKLWNRYVLIEVIKKFEPVQPSFEESQEVV